MPHHRAFGVCSTSHMGCKLRRCATHLITGNVERPDTLLDSLRKLVLLQRAQRTRLLSPQQAPLSNVIQWQQRLCHAVPHKQPHGHVVHMMACAALLPDARAAGLQAPQQPPQQRAPVVRGRGGQVQAAIIIPAAAAAAAAVTATAASAIGASRSCLFLTGWAGVALAHSSCGLAVCIATVHKLPHCCVCASNGCMGCGHSSQGTQVPKGTMLCLQGCVFGHLGNSPVGAVWV